MGGTGPASGFSGLAACMLRVQGVWSKSCSSLARGLWLRVAFLGWASASCYRKTTRASPCHTRSGCPSTNRGRGHSTPVRGQPTGGTPRRCSTTFGAWPKCTAPESPIPPPNSAWPKCTAAELLPKKLGGTAECPQGDPPAWSAPRAPTGVECPQCDPPRAPRVDVRIMLVLRYRPGVSEGDEHWSVMLH